MLASGSPEISVSLPPLSVADDAAHLVDASGRPFFWTGDTAWELFHRLDRAQAGRYLAARAEQGFNVIQAVALAEMDGFNHPNAYGDRPLAGDDPASPLTTPGADPADPAQYDYWDHVDHVVSRATSLGLYVAMAPTWGSHVRSGRFTEASAEAYGRFLGARYGDDRVVWLLGADRQPYAQEAIHRALARGLAIGATGGEDHSKLLITYHPPDGDSSSFYFHNEPWLDFNLFQSGHGGRDLPNYAFVISDLARQPRKPTLDSEPRYEDAPVAYSLANGRFDAFDSRQAAHWSAFAGAFGHTYGHVSVWQMYEPGRTCWGEPRSTWAEALDADGAAAMGHLRRLMESRPLVGRVGDQALLLDAYAGGDHLRATRGPLAGPGGGAYAFIYAPTGRPIAVDVSRLAGGATAGGIGAAVEDEPVTVTARWYDPRQGTWSDIGSFDVAVAGSATARTFAPPTSGRGNDWVLVLDAVPVPPAPPRLAGDANLDGRIDAADYAATDRGFALALAGWENGDFDGSGFVTVDDYVILDVAFLRRPAAGEARATAAPLPVASLFADEPLSGRTAEDLLADGGDDLL